MILAYWYNKRTRDYFVEPITHNFGEYHHNYIRIGLAIELSAQEFRYRCRKKLKKGIILKDYSHMFIVWRSDLNKWTVSYIPF